MADGKKKVDRAALKASEKEAKAAKRAERKRNRQQMWQAFNMQRKRDKALVPIMIASVLGMALVFFLIGLLFHGQWFMLILGLALGIMLAMWLFTKRLEKSVYDEASDKPGAAAWALENLRSGPGMMWKSKTGVAANTHMDAVHRVVGNPGIVLVGEGEMHRVKPLLEQQKKRLSRIAQAPIYEIYAGEGEGQVPIRRLQRELMKLPRNIKKDEAYELAARLESMDSTTAAGPGLPKGPMPKGGKMSGMNRRARRQAARGKK